MRISYGRAPTAIDLRLPIIAAISGTIALFFWLGSRYPALNQKALMGGDSPLSGIAFDVLVEIAPASPFWWEATANTINWVYTNWKGMTFGVLFGACLLTLLSLVRHRSFSSPVANAALGTAIGAPLGVCVNCAAPIARSLHAAGMRLETSIAALLASPTLNVIVVSMTFALLPTYVAVIKLAGMIAFILIVVPLLVRCFGPATTAVPIVGTAGAMQGAWIDRLRPSEEYRADGRPLLTALRWSIVAFLRNLAFVAIVTVPLMLVAGALGSLLITYFPLDNSHIFIPNGRNLVVAGALLGVLALFAVFLPVPIAFDVVVAAALYGAGWPAKYLTVLLIGLGSFSIYSYLIVGRMASLRFATAMYLSVAALAWASGVVAWQIEKVDKRNSWLNVERSLQDAKPFDAPSLLAPQALAPAAIGAMVGELQRRSPAPISVRGAKHEGRGKIEIAHTRLASSKATGGVVPFKRMMGGEIGLDERHAMSPIRVFEPYSEFNAIASGDVNGDGWVDIVMASDASVGGLALFINVGGRFVRQSVDLGPLSSSFVGSVALIDLDNDGRPDLFLSTYGEGAHVLWNHDGAFSHELRTPLPNGVAAMIGAPAFADLDRDGRLDIVAGNWTTTVTHRGGRANRSASTSRILWNEGDRKFSAQDLEGVPGQTLTSLVADFNGDGYDDIFIGHDTTFTDTIYLGDGRRGFRQVKKSDKLVPWLAYETMSADLGDVGNTLREDLYLGQIAIQRRGSGRQLFDTDTSYCLPEAIAVHGAEGDCYQSVLDRSRIIRMAMPDVPKCEKIVDRSYRDACAAMAVLVRVTGREDQPKCDRLAHTWPRLKPVCENLMIEGNRVSDAELTAMDYVPGVRDRNILLKRQQGGYEDVTRDAGVGFPGWTWNARFVDLDQDGWQDLLVATGYILSRDYLPSAYYRNRGDGTFANASKAYGFTDTIPTTAYLRIDFDRDGDVDIIRAPTVSQPIVHRNDAPAGGALWVTLRDEIGNSHGIGSVVTIRTREEGSGRQMRHIRASGGFISVDAPRAHFGLGKAATVDEIKVVWPDGAVTTLTEPIEANFEIVLHRKK